MRFFKQTLWVLIFTLTIFGTTFTVKAQNNTVPSSRIDIQADVVKAKQSGESALRSLVADLKNENENLSKDLIELNKQKTELETKISKLNENLKESESLPNPAEKPDLQPTKDELNKAQSSLVETKNQLAEKQSKFIANQQAIIDAETELESKTKELKQEESTLQKQLISLGTQVSFYVIWIICYWVVAQLVKSATNKIIPDGIIKNVFNYTINILAIIATVITLLFAFIGNLTLLITSFGVFSAALVVALQDFVSSFFAWVMVRTTSQYRLGDTISITTGKGIVTGPVINIGIFRTSIREKVGGTSLDKERLTGRILTFPNNLILKESLTNHTKEDNIVWHSFDLIITFESDTKKAKEVLENICINQFQYALDHEQHYFKDISNVKKFKPRVYMSIAGDGPQFTIWFATKIGYFRERLEKYSVDILEEFKKNNIDLAYSTTRFIDAPDLIKK